jgi:hypothetical protein
MPGQDRQEVALRTVSFLRLDHKRETIGERMGQLLNEGPPPKEGLAHLAELWLFATVLTAKFQGWCPCCRVRHS